MPDDPREILKAAGVECRALDEYQPFRNLTKVSTVIAGFVVVRQDKADAAILALARLVAKYKWQREIQVVGALDYNGAIARLDELWEHREDPDA